MKRGIMLFFTAVLLLVLPLTFSAVSTGDKYNVTSANMQDAAQNTADCENTNTQLEFIECRLTKPALFASPQLTCRASLYPAWCEELFNNAQNCNELTAFERDECLQLASYSMERFIPQPKAYALLLTQNLQNEVETAYYNQTISIENATMLIEKFTIFSHAVIRDQPVSSLTILFAEARNIWNDIFDSR